MSLASKTQLLIETLDGLVPTLRHQGEEHWAAWLESDRDLLRRGDYEGARHFMSAFGGMGSLNDQLFLPPDLLSRAYYLAKEISDEAITE